MLFVLVLNWWVMLLWRDLDHWQFSVFFTLVLWTISMYVLALALYPPHLPQDVNYREMFETNRIWFLSTWTTMCMLDLIVTYQRDQAILELQYLDLVGHFALITFIGIFIKHRYSVVSQRLIEQY